MLARAYLESGQLAEATEAFEQILSSYNLSRLDWGIWDVLIHYYLGQAYELSGLRDQAVEQYETFLAIWSNPDSSLKSVDDARERLTRLKNES